MVANKKITGRATSLPAGLAIGAVCSLAATLVLTAILAKLVEAETLPVEKIGYGIMVLLIVSSFAGAMISFGRIKRQRMLVCIVSGGDLLRHTHVHHGTVLRWAVQRRRDDRAAGSGGQRSGCTTGTAAGQGSKTYKNQGAPSLICTNCNGG